jgi:hypothetical protein
MPEDAVYVGRPTRYGNPFSIRRVDCDSMGGGMCWLVTDGRITRPHLDTKRHAAEVAVDLYRLHIGPMGAYEIEDADLAALRGHDLVCWCPLDQPCHADVLLELANGEA